MLFFTSECHIVMITIDFSKFVKIVIPFNISNVIHVPKIKLDIVFDLRVEFAQPAISQ